MQNHAMFYAFLVYVLGICHSYWFMYTTGVHKPDGRTGLWQLLRKYGCPEKFTTMIEAQHTGIMANVNVGGEVSESFSVTNGVKQGCVLAPTLFSIFLSAMLDEAFRDMGNGVYIQSRLSTDLFNVAHFRAKTRDAIRR